PTWNVATHLLETESLPRSRRIREMLEDMGAVMGRRVAQHRELIMANVESVTLTLLSGTAVGILIGAVIAVTLSRRIVTALQVVGGAARQVAEGDLTGSELNISSRDEVGELAETFNTMRARLREMAAQIRLA